MSSVIFEQLQKSEHVIWFVYVRLWNSLEIFNTLTWNNFCIRDLLVYRNIQIQLLDTLTWRNDIDKSLESLVIDENWNSISIRNFLTNLIDWSESRISYLFSNIWILTNWFTIEWEEFFWIRLLHNSNNIIYLTVEDLYYLIKEIEDKTNSNFFFYRELSFLYMWFKKWLKLSWINKDFHYSKFEWNFENILISLVKTWISFSENEKIFIQILYEQWRTVCKKLVENCYDDFLSNISQLDVLSLNEITVESFNILLLDIDRHLSDIFNFEMSVDLFYDIISELINSIFDKLFEFCIWKWICDEIIVELFLNIRPHKWFIIYFYNLETFILSEKFIFLFRNTLINYLTLNNYNKLSDILFSKLDNILNTKSYNVFYHALFNDDIFITNVNKSINSFSFWDSLILLSRSIICCKDLYLKSSLIESLNNIIEILFIHIKEVSMISTSSIITLLDAQKNNFINNNLLFEAKIIQDWIEKFKTL